MDGKSDVHVTVHRDEHVGKRLRDKSDDTVAIAEEKRAKAQRQRERRESEKIGSIGRKSGAFSFVRFVFLTNIIKC